MRQRLSELMSWFVGRSWAAVLVGAMGVLFLAGAAYGVGLVLGDLIPTGGSDAPKQSANRDRTSTAPPPATAPASSPTPVSRLDPLATQPASSVVMPSPSPNPPRPASPSSTPSPTAVPGVSNLIVCDRTVDCGVGEATLSRGSVVACLRTTSGADHRPLVLVATNREEPPAGAYGFSVVARSEPFEPSGGFSCYSVQGVGGQFAPGSYWMWVLQETVPLMSTTFVVGPTAEATAQAGR